MQIVRDLAGYSLGSADLMRRVISKKKTEQMEAERQSFIYGKKDENGEYIIDGCIRRGIDEKTAIEIFDEIYDFANYAFNKSHAAAYAYITYQTAYLKTFYPVEFMAALISSAEDADKVNEYIINAKNMGIALYPPDVNMSTDTFTVEENAIRFGLASVKNVGRSFVQRLVAEREANGAFAGFSDFVSRMTGKDMNKRAVEGLIMCGAFDSMGIRRAQLMEVYESVIETEARTSRSNVAGQFTLFDTDADDESGASEIDFPDIKEFDKRTLLRMEKQTIGMYLSGHPIEEYKDKIAALTEYDIGRILSAVEKDEDGGFRLVEGSGIADGSYVRLCAVIGARKNKTTRSSSQMAFVKLEDMYGSLEMLVFPQVLKKYSSVLQEEAAILAEGKISLREDEEPKLLCERVFPLDSVNPPERKKKLYVKIAVQSKQIMEELAEITGAYPGTMPMLLYFEDTGRRLETSGKRNIEPTDELMKKLSEKYGSENVVIK